MNLHEYQSKILLKAAGLPVLRGFPCYTPGEVEAAVDNLGGNLWVIKAQIHAGGRGKGGGVKLAKNSQEAREIAEEMIGMQLVSPQTGPQGKLVRKVYVEEGCDIAKEFYLSLLVDRSEKNISIVASSEGGMDIEEVAEKSPDKIITVGIDPRVGFQNFYGMQIGFNLGLDVSQSRKLTGITAKLYELFVSNDLSLVEINPLVLTSSGEFVLLDAKCTVDNNALFRHPELKCYNDYDELDPRDLAASKFGLSYVGLDGTIGCMVNGAGLAMATMDIIKNFGASPANFLDVGGGASKDAVTEAFKILVGDPTVKAVLVNIFGGIVKCDLIANGIIDAAKEVGIKIPLVVRLQGTNVELGRKILAESDLKIETAESMADAAKAVIASIK